MSTAVPTFRKPLVAEAASARPEVDAWRRAIDQMLLWMTPSSGLPAEDALNADVLAAAIDYAVDQVEDANGDAAPDSVVPSGSGRIAMEWNDGPVTVIVEFTARDSADYTEFRHGKLHRRGALVRDPRSRLMELRG